MLLVVEDVEVVLLVVELVDVVLLVVELVVVANATVVEVVVVAVTAFVVVDSHSVFTDGTNPRPLSKTRGASTTDKRVDD